MSFWTHEYCKHGTCCTDVFPDQHSYFRGVLDLNKKYNMDTILDSAGIVASADTVR